MNTLGVWLTGGKCTLVIEAIGGEVSFRVEKENSKEKGMLAHS